MYGSTRAPQSTRTARRADAIAARACTGAVAVFPGLILGLLALLAGCQSRTDLTPPAGSGDAAAQASAPLSADQLLDVDESGIDAAELDPFAALADTSDQAGALVQPAATAQVSAEDLVRDEDEDEANFTARVRSALPRRVAVKFRPDTPANQKAALHAQFNHAVVGRIPQIDIDIVKVPTGQRAKTVIDRYKNHPRIEFAEAEVFRQPAMIPNDPWFPGWQTYLHTSYQGATGTIPAMDAQRAWDITTGSPGIVVAVIDSGIYYNHPEFLPRYQSGEIYGYNFMNYDPDHDHDIGDWDGHGTLVAGVIGAQTNNGIGMAGACRNPVMVCRTGYGFDANMAIVYATDHGARVINMSYGGPGSSSTEAACQYAFDHGVVLAGAAGNNCVLPNFGFYPAAYPTVLAVTCTDGTLQPGGCGCGDWVDIAALGGGVLTTCRPTAQYCFDVGLGFAGGSSLATPFIASAAALVLSANPNLMPTDVINILRSTAEHPAGGFDVYTGYGLVNFYRAVLAAQNTAPTVDTTPPHVTITSPPSGAILSGLYAPIGTGTGGIQVYAYDDHVGTVRVDLYVDNTFISSDTVLPHEWALNTTPFANGPHTLSARAYDASGNMAVSAPVYVTISNSTGDTTPPTVGFMAPTSGATVTGTYSVQVSAGDNVGVASVSLSMGGTSLGTDTSAPYTFSWNTTTTTNGSHTLAATARDAAGNAATAQVSATVNNTTGDTIAPTIGITSPAAGATVSGQVNVTVNTSDNVAVARVELFVDGVFVKRSTSAPFTTRWRSNQAAPGPHTLQTKAFDAAGNMGVSAPITVYKN